MGISSPVQHRPRQSSHRHDGSYVRKSAVAVVSLVAPAAVLPANRLQAVSRHAKPHQCRAIPRGNRILHLVGQPRPGSEAVSDMSSQGTSMGEIIYKKSSVCFIVRRARFRNPHSDVQVIFLGIDNHSDTVRAVLCAVYKHSSISPTPSLRLRVSKKSVRIDFQRNRIRTPPVNASTQCKRHCIVCKTW